PPLTARRAPLPPAPTRSGTPWLPASAPAGARGQGGARAPPVPSRIADGGFARLHRPACPWHHPPRGTRGATGRGRARGRDRAGEQGGPGCGGAENPRSTARSRGAGDRAPCGGVRRPVPVSLVVSFRTDPGRGRGHGAAGRAAKASP